MEDREFRFGEDGAGGVTDRTLYGSTAGARLSEGYSGGERREQERLQTELVDGSPVYFSAP